MNDTYCLGAIFTPSSICNRNYKWWTEYCLNLKEIKTCGYNYVFVNDKNIECPVYLRSTNHSVDEINSIACGENHVVTIANKKLCGWGSNAYHQLGSDAALEPMDLHGGVQSLAQTLGAADAEALQVFAGGYQTYVVVQDPQTQRQLLFLRGAIIGMETVCDNWIHFPLLLGSDRRIKDIACSDGHAVCVTEDGGCFAWGCNLHGQLGLGHTRPMPLHPQKIDLFGSLVLAAKPACGLTHSLVLTSLGQVFFAGNMLQPPATETYGSADLIAVEEVNVGLLNEEPLYKKQKIEVRPPEREAATADPFVKVPDWQVVELEGDVEDVAAGDFFFACLVSSDDLTQELYVCGSLGPLLPNNTKLYKIPLPTKDDDLKWTVHAGYGCIFIHKHQGETRGA
eukprot:Platyproteum_vivax@DN2099_c0_g1_i1.p1